MLLVHLSFMSLHKLVYFDKQAGMARYRSGQMPEGSRKNLRSEFFYRLFDIRKQGESGASFTLC